MKKRRYVIVAALAAVVFGIFYIWSVGPSRAVINDVSKDVKGANITVGSEKTIDYKLMSIKIPDRYVLKTKSEGFGNPLYIQELFTVPVKDLQSVFGDQLAVTIGAVPKSGMADISDIRLRNRDEGYRLLSNEENIMIFEKNSTIYEIGAFIKNGSNYTSLVFSGPQSNKEVLKKELNNCAASTVWN